MLTAMNMMQLRLATYIHALASTTTTSFKDTPRPASGASNSTRAFSGPSVPRVKTSEEMTSRPTTWFQFIFKTNEYTLSQIKGCLALEIGDLLHNILPLLSDRTQVELFNTDNDLAKVDILFKVMNSRTGDFELLCSFCRQLARLIGMKHMLRLDADGFNYEEILSSELLGPSGAAYRREGLRRSIAQSKLTARRKARPHPYRRTSSTAGRVKPHSARRAASDSEDVRSYSDSVPETVCLHDIAFTEELGSGTTFFMHTAKHKGRPVVVKVFNATANPRQLVEKEIQLAKELIHPNLLRLEGVSAPVSPTQFITYQSALTADRHLGAALDANLETSVALAFQMVGELAAGLNYLHLQSIPVQRIQITHFNVLFDSNQKFLIALDPAALDQAPLSSSPVQVGVDVLWRHFNELCELVLKSANRLIHDDDVERDPDVVDLSSPTSDVNGPVNLIFPDGSRGVKKKPLAVEPSSSVIPPRREFVWRKLSRGNQTLTMISRHLGSTFRPSATSLNRLQIQSTSRKTFHRCAGYLREEITLATRSRNSAILTYDSPSPFEICKVCRQEVRLEVFECICGNSDVGSAPIVHCRSCKRWSHAACVKVAVGAETDDCLLCAAEAAPSARPETARPPRAHGAHLDGDAAWLKFAEEQARLDRAHNPDGYVAMLKFAKEQVRLRRAHPGGYAAMLKIAEEQARLRRAHPDRDAARLKFAEEQARLQRAHDPDGDAAMLKFAEEQARLHRAHLDGYARLKFAEEQAPHRHGAHPDRDAVLKFAEQARLRQAHLDDSALLRELVEEQAQARLEQAHRSPIPSSSPSAHFVALEGLME